MERVRWLRVIVTMTTIAACVTYVHLSSTEQRSVVFPTSVPFGTRQINTTTTLPITISPAFGLNSDIVQSIAEQAGGCPNFNFLGSATPNAPVTSTCADGSGSGSGFETGSGEAGSGSGTECTTFNTQSFTFNVQFTPTITGFQSCNLNLVISGVGQTITLTGTGQAPPIDVELETGTTTATTRCTTCVLDFDKVNVNLASSPKVAKVLNIGSGTATLTSISVTAGASVFAITSGNTANRPLGPNGVPAESYQVTCTPQAVGPTTGTLTVATNDPVTPSLTLQLKCEGIMSDLVAQPGTLDVVARAHELSSTFTLDLKNSGTALLTLDSFTFTQPTNGTLQMVNQGALTGATIAPLNAETRTAQIRLNTTGVGDIAGNLRIVFDGNQTRDIPITGKSEPTTFSLAPIGPPGPANLGVTCVGATKRQRFTLIANSPSDFALRGIDKIVLGDDVYEIEAVDPPSLPTSGAPKTLIGDGGNMVEFDVAFTPTAAGLFNGGFSLDTDIPESPNAEEVVSTTVGLMASGLPAGQNITPVGPIDFGTVTTGQMSATAQKVTLTNCSATPLTITRSEITGDPDFKIMTAPATEVPANSQVEIEVVLNPEFGGAKRGELELEYTNGLSKVVLIGNGDGPLRPIDEPDILDPRDSYYACSTGTASGSLLVWLALGGVLVFRRRRR